MHFSFIIIAVLLLISSYQMWSNRNNAKGITAVTFYVQLFASIGLICLVWIGRPAESRIEYAISITILAIIGIVHGVLLYNKGKKATQQ